MGARFALGWRPTSNVFWLVPILLGIAVFAIYGMVNIEERYVTVGFLVITLTFFATLQHSTSTWTAISPASASAAVILLAFLAAGESARTIAELRRHLSGAHSPGGWYDADTYRAAKALNDLGIRPGDTVACAGPRACLMNPYWARLAGVRILTELYLPPPRKLYPSLASLSNRDQAIEVIRRQGDKVLVGYFSPGLMTGTSPASAGWHELDETPFYVLPLNLPSTPPAIAHP